MSRLQVIVDYHVGGDFFNSLAIGRAIQAKTGAGCLVRKPHGDGGYQIFSNYDDLSGLLIPSQPPLPNDTLIYLCPKFPLLWTNPSIEFNIDAPDIRAGRKLDNNDISFKSSLAHLESTPDKTNIFETVPSRVSDELLKRAWETEINLGNDLSYSWSERLAHYQQKKPVIMLTLGCCSSYDYVKIAREVSQTVQELDGSLIVTTSPRMREHEMMFKLFCSVLESKIQPYIHGFGVGQGAAKENPYFAMLHIADAVIVTGDSMSMLADSCATKKPVAVYIPNTKDMELEPALKKANDAYGQQITSQIRFMVEQARILMPHNLKDWIGTNYTPINSAPKIADYVLQLCKEKFPDLQISPNSLADPRSRAELERKNQQSPS